MLAAVTPWHVTVTQGLASTWQGHPELAKARQAWLGARGHLPLGMFLLHKYFFLEIVQLLFGMLCKAVLTKPRGPWGGSTSVSILQPWGCGLQQLLPSFPADTLRCPG